MRHVYVCTSYPSYSETFVGVEMQSLVDQGDDVLVYSLRMPPGGGLRPALSYLKPPCGRAKLVLWSPLGLWLLLKSCQRGLRFQPRDLSRLMFAAAHAARMSRGVRQSADTEDALIVHAHFLDRPADVVAFLRDDRLIKLVTVHASDAWQAAAGGLRRWRIASFDHIVCASEYVRRGLAPDRTVGLTVIHCGVGLPARQGSAAKTSMSGIRVCTVARLIPVKNHAYVARVLDTLVRLGIPVEWHVVGDGPLMPWLNGYAGSVSSANFQVVRHGALPHVEALNVLCLCDVMVLPSSAIPPGPDGIPVALIEAMASGVLVVSTPVGGIPELVIDGVTGIMGDPQDPEACASVIAGVMSDPTRLKSLLDGAFTHVLESFNAAVSAAQLVELVTQVAADRQGVTGAHR